MESLLVAAFFIILSIIFKLIINPFLFYLKGNYSKEDINKKEFFIFEKLCLHLYILYILFIPYSFFFKYDINFFNDLIISFIPINCFYFYIVNMHLKKLKWKTYINNMTDSKIFINGEECEFMCIENWSLKYKTPNNKIGYLTYDNMNNINILL